MNQQDRHQNRNEATLERWKREMEDNGFIEDEQSLYTYLMELEEQTEPKLYSQLLSYAALTRLHHGELDSVVYAWMERAKALDPDNNRANHYLAQFQWKSKQDFFTTFVFPTIRETDNRPLKKKTAEQIISVCDAFFEKAENDLEELEEGRQIAQRTGNEGLITTYAKLIALLEQAIEEVAGVRKAAEEYEQTISGAFYNTTFYFDMKAHLENIERIKDDWSEQFLTESEKTVEMKSPLTELDDMIGLTNVKKRVHDFYQFLKYQKERKAHGFRTKDEISLNMVFTGNPGTGKTTLVRLLAKIYHELGVLPREEVIEVDRSHLVGAYVGQTEENVKAVVEKALGGILFIDEAYSLKREGQSGNDFGQTAIDTLVSLMTGAEFGGKFAVVLAGYPDEMRQFLDTNPGLRSRFPRSNLIHLDDYSDEELLLIAEKFAKDNDYILTEDAKIQIKKLLEKERVDDTFGNARTVRNIILDAIFQKGAEQEESQSILDYTILEGKDFSLEDQEEDTNAISQLEELIGLKEVKDEVKRIVSFVKMQQYRREQHLPVLPLQLHSVFMGNPGTGKTTVAKIYAEALKECGILKRGHILITSRADFVAGYVGQTAIKTKKKIREALGGVLFIDEAYSLLGQTAGDFGKEVVDTLVDEMTKHNENLVVILAGYPKEMNSLLESNPGLKSRFKKFLQFKDYSIPELIKIMEQYGARYHYQLNKRAKDFLKEELKQFKINGNGRFATNLMDEAIQAQALRLMEEEEQLEVSRVTEIDELDIKKALEKMRNGEL